MESGRFVPGVGTGLPEEEDVKRVILIIILIVSILSVGYSVYKLSRPEPEAFMRQEKEENIADQFLEDVKNRTDSKPGTAARKIGKASKAQIFLEEGRLPAAVVACVGGGSNAMGAFYNFIDDDEVKLMMKNSIILL